MPEADATKNTTGVVLLAHRLALSRVLAAEAVRWDDETLTQHSRDTWALSQLRALRGTLTARPLCVITPGTREEVAAVLAYANAHRIPLVPYGAGSGVCGGVLPANGSIVIDMRRMNRLVEINETALLVRVQPGMMGSAFETALNHAGYSAGHFPQSIDVSTVGGWVATRAAGQHSTRYGCIEDVVLALEVVLPDGRVLQTRVGPRSATGPDLRHLFLGSEGTLGVITEITARIFPVPETRVGQSFSFASMQAGLQAIRLIMRHGWKPPVIRLYDGFETARLFTAVSRGDNCLLLLLSEGPASLTTAEMAACEAVAVTHGGEPLGDAPVQQWLGERNTVPVFETFLRRGIVLDTIEVATTWDRIDDLYREVIAALQAVPGIFVASGHSSHSYTQGTNIYFTFVARPDDPARCESTYLECWEKAMEATLRCDGTISHHHGIGRLRTGWMGRELGVGLDVLRGIKRMLDPNGIMNPGALIPDES